MIDAGKLFVGRDREIRAIRVGLEDACSGRGSLFLLGGEPGIGKTRLLEEVAVRATERGLVPLWGRCWEGAGAPEYWPWVQVLRSHIRAQRPEELARQTGSAAGHLVRIVPELRERLPEAPEPSTLSPEHARFALLDAATLFLAAAAEAQPVAILLDDLHAADLPSLLLLRFLAAQLAENWILVVGAYREPDVRFRKPASELLGELLRWGKDLPLTGLELQDVARLIEGITGVSPSPGVLGAVHGVTDGNPFFVDELARLLEAEGRLGEEPPRQPLGVPEGVRAAIRRRAAMPSEETRSLVEVASVVGRDFDLPVVARAAGLSRDAAHHAIAGAVAAGMVRELHAGLERFSFTHALFRETLYDDLMPVRRRELHRTVGEAIEEVRGADPGEVVTELAHHFYEAAPEVGPRHALPYLRRAAGRAMGLLAYEDAAMHLRRALELAGRAQGDDALRCELLLELGEADSRAGDHDDARKCFLEAAELARRVGSAELFARAALGYGTGLGGQGASAYRANDTLIGLLEEALHRLGETESADRVRVLSRLAVELYTTGRIEERDALSGQAVEVARRINDPRLLLEALLDYHEARLGPDTVEERTAAAPEILELARRVGARELTFQSHFLRLQSALETGAFDIVEEDVDACVRLAEELRVPLYGWQVLFAQTMMAFTRGSLDEADSLNEEAYALREHVSVQPATSGHLGIRFCIRWMQGRIEEVEPAYRELAQRAPRSAFAVGLPFVHSLMGAEVEARTGFHRVAAEAFRDVPRWALWSGTLYIAALTASQLEDVESSEAVYDLLLPQADRMATSMRALNLGSIATALGVAASTRRRWEDAEHHFEQGLERNLATGNRPFTALTLREYAAMLLARGGRGDVDRARRLLDDALEMIDRFGLHGLRDRALALRGRAGDEPREGYRALLRRQGDFWHVAFGGQEARIRDLRGLHHLAALVATPHREVHVLELAVDRSPDRVRGGAGAPAGTLGDAGVVLDVRAKRAYRQRLEQIEQDLEEASAWQDPARVELLERERDALVRELAAAVGLGGRDRRAASADDRARVAVTRAIRRAIERIERTCPALGTHLMASVRTGWTCSYAPDPDNALCWET